MGCVTAFHSNHDWLMLNQHFQSKKLMPPEKAGIESYAITLLLNVSKNYNGWQWTNKKMQIVKACYYLWHLRYLFKIWVMQDIISSMKAGRTFTDLQICDY